MTTVAGENSKFLICLVDCFLAVLSLLTVA